MKALILLGLLVGCSKSGPLDTEVQADNMIRINVANSTVESIQVDADTRCFFAISNDYGEISAMSCLRVRR